MMQIRKEYGHNRTIVKMCQDKIVAYLHSPLRVMARHAAPGEDGYQTGE
jgi:hypothetical protein